MIGALKALFTPNASETDEQRRHRLHLVAAALLIETARADFTQDASEQAALEALLADRLGLAAGEVAALVAAAEARVDAATSLYEFTRVVNDHYSAAEKLALIESMWAVAWADDDVDKYEEHLIRRVAELTYVPHADFIRSKLAAKA